MGSLSRKEEICPCCSESNESQQNHCLPSNNLSFPKKLVSGSTWHVSFRIKYYRSLRNLGSEIGFAISSTVKQ